MRRVDERTPQMSQDQGHQAIGACRGLPGCADSVSAGLHGSMGASGKLSQPYGCEFVERLRRPRRCKIHLSAQRVALLDDRAQRQDLRTLPAVGSVVPLPPRICPEASGKYGAVDKALREAPLADGEIEAGVQHGAFDLVREPSSRWLDRHLGSVFLVDGLKDRPGHLNPKRPKRVLQVVLRVWPYRFVGCQFRAYGGLCLPAEETG